MEKKLFEQPEATIVEFSNEDIIFTSGTGEGPGQSYDDWGGGSNQSPNIIIILKADFTPPFILFYLVKTNIIIQHE